MTVHTTTTAYGRPAAVALHARLRAIKSGDPLAAVTIVVPTNYAGVSVRRLLGSSELGSLVPGTSGVVGLQVTTVARLAETLGAPSLTAAGRRPATTPIVSASVRATLDVDPGIFEPVAAHSATVDALVQAHRELGVLDDRQLDILAGTGARPADVVRVHLAVQRRLSCQFYEVPDLLSAAIAAVPTSPAVAELGSLLCYLPQRLSTAESDLLLTLGRQTRLDVVVGMTGVADADADVVRTLEALGASPVPPAEPIMRATRVIDTSDADEECRSAVEIVVSALRGEFEEPVAPERIGILYRAAEPYARSLRAELDTTNIAWNGYRVDPVLESAVGRWLLCLIRLADRGWRRSDVMRLLAEAPTITSADGDTPRRVPVARWERLSREAGITAGADAWATALTEVADGRRAAAADEASSDAPREWLIRREQRRATDADALRTFVGDLVDAHRRYIIEADSWTALADGLTHLLATLLDSRWDRWLSEAREAAERVALAIRRLTALDDINGASLPSPARAAEILERELTDDLGRHGTFGCGVLVGPMSVAVGLDLDVVVVMGMAEGVTPSPVVDDPLLHDDEREVLGGALPLRRNRGHQQHRQVIAALSAGGGERIVTWSRGDLRRNASREPSRWLASLAGSHRENVASYAQRVAHTVFPSTPTGYLLGRLQRDDPRDLTRHPLVAKDPVLIRNATLVQARRTPSFTRFDGNLAGVTGWLGRVDEAPTSASRLETWARCPHAYFVRYVLKVESLEQPEARLDISALDRGSLIHDVLEQWIDEQLAADAVPASDKKWSTAQRARLIELAEAASNIYASRGLTGHPTLWGFTHGHILRDLRTLLVEDDAHRHRTGASPAAVELPYGGPGEYQPAAIELPDGTVLSVRGRIDRVDRTADGAIHVIDYKTGSAIGKKDLANDPVNRGRSLQLSLYARALEGWQGVEAGGIRADYWYISSKGNFTWRGVVLDDEVIARQHEALGTIARGIHSGMFVANPDRTTTPWVTCAYCDPDGLGTAQLGARFEKLGRTAPELRPYVLLAEPELVEDDGAGSIT